MKGVMTALAIKHQTMIRPVSLRSVAAMRAHLAGMICVNLDGHTAIQCGFIGYHTVQLSKGPFGIGNIGLSLLSAHFLALFGAFTAWCSFSNICQLFQTNQTVWVSGYNAFGDYMIGIGFQPSLSSTDHHQTAGCSASAFVLQT